MVRFRTVLVLIVSVIATAGALAGPASATPSRSAGPTITGPTPQQYPPFDYPAGEVCPFAIHGVFPVNHVVGYTYTDSDGRVVAAYYRGALTVRVTRVSSGAAVTKDIGGSGVQAFAADGSSTLYGVGPFAVSLHPGDAPRPEFAVLHGISAVHLAADGSKQVLYSSRIENVCAQLR